MSLGNVGTGAGAPVGGAVPTFGGTSNAPAAAQTGAFDFGSTLNSNMALNGLGKILEGAGILMQQAGAAGAQTTAPAPTTNTNTGAANTAGPTAFDNLANSLGGQGKLNDILTQLNGLVNQLSGIVNQLGAQPAPQQQQPAPQPQVQQQPAPQPQPDPVQNLVNRANVDPQLKPAVTQVAQDPVGNKLLQGAVDGGLNGIQVTNLPAGVFGQFLPDTKQVQIAPGTLQGQDLVRTVAHELVHAATPRDGDSIREEGLADKIGAEVQGRVNGNAPGYVLGGESYNGLPQDNGIVNSLRLLGITI